MKIALYTRKTNENSFTFVESETFILFFKENENIFISNHRKTLKIVQCLALILFAFQLTILYKEVTLFDRFISSNYILAFYQLHFFYSNIQASEKAVSHVRCFQETHAKKEQAK